MDEFVIVQEGESVIFKHECLTIAEIVADKNFKLYNGGLVVEDGTPYHILYISRNENGSLDVTLIYHDHYQIGYHEGGPQIYMSDDTYIDDEEICPKCSNLMYMEVDHKYYRCKKCGNIEVEEGIDISEIF